MYIYIYTYFFNINIYIYWYIYIYINIYIDIYLNRLNIWLSGIFFILACTAAPAPPARRGVKERASGSMSHSTQPSCSCCLSHREALSGPRGKQPATTVYRLPPQAWAGLELVTPRGSSLSPSLSLSVSLSLSLRVALTASTEQKWSGGLGAGAIETSGILACVHL